MNWEKKTRRQHDEDLKMRNGNEGKLVPQSYLTTFHLERQMVIEKRKQCFIWA